MSPDDILLIPLCLFCLVAVFRYWLEYVGDAFAQGRLSVALDIGIILAATPWFLVGVLVCIICVVFALLMKEKRSAIDRDLRQRQQLRLSKVHVQLVAVANEKVNKAQRRRLIQTSVDIALLMRHMRELEALIAILSWRIAEQEENQSIRSTMLRVVLAVGQQYVLKMKDDRDSLIKELEDTSQVIDDYSDFADEQESALQQAQEQLRTESTQRDVLEQVLKVLGQEHRECLELVEHLITGVDAVRLEAQSNPSSALGPPRKSSRRKQRFAKVYEMIENKKNEHALKLTRDMKQIIDDASSPYEKSKIDRLAGDNLLQLSSDTPPRLTASAPINDFGPSTSTKRPNAVTP